MHFSIGVNKTCGVEGKMAQVPPLRKIAFKQRNGRNVSNASANDKVCKFEGFMENTFHTEVRSVTILN